MRRRILVLVLIWLFVTPVVMATTASTQQTDARFQMAELRVGDRYAWDLTLHADDPGWNETIAGAFVLQIDEPVTWEGTPGDPERVPILLTRLIGDWNAQGLDASGDGEQVTITGSERHTLLYRPVDGAITDVIVDEAWVEQVRIDHGVSTLEGERRTIQPLSYVASPDGGTNIRGHLGAFRELTEHAGAHMDTTEGLASLLGQVMGERGVRPDRVAIMDGTLAYDMEGGKSSGNVAGGAMSCGVGASDIGIQYAAADTFHYVAERSWWLQPYLPVPVLMEAVCTVTIGGAATFEAPTTWSVSYRLADATRGSGPTVPMPWQQESVQAPEPVARPEAVTHPGLPRYANDALLFPLDGLRAALDATEDDDVVAERWADGRYRVAHAAYAANPQGDGAECPGADEPAANDPPLPPGIVPSEEVGVTPTYCPAWALMLHGESGSGRAVTFWRHLDADESELAAGVLVHPDQATVKVSFGAMDMPLVPMDDIIGDWERLGAVDVDEWARHRESSVEIAARGDGFEVSLRSDLRSEDGAYSDATYHLASGHRTFLRTATETESAAGSVASHPTTTATTVDMAAVPDRYQTALASGLAVTVLFAVMIFWEALRAFVALPLYAKLRGDKLLDHDTRDQIHSMVGANPGITAAEIQDVLGSAPTTTLHHLRTLEAHGRLSSLRQGRTRHFFHRGAHGAREMVALAVLHSPSTRRVYDHIIAAPGANQGDLAKALGVSHPNVRWHTTRLVRAGLVCVERRGRSAHYLPVAADGTPDPGEPSYGATSSGS